MTVHQTDGAWTTERTDDLRRLWIAGFAAAEIARRVDSSRNAVISKARRIGLPERSSDETLLALATALKRGEVAEADVALIRPDRLEQLVAAGAELAEEASGGPSSKPSRPGQSAFRNNVFKNHGAICCITGTAVQSVVQAAHLVPHARGRNQDPSNGIPLRADIHILFDDDLIAIEPGTMRVMVSPSLQNTEYEPLDGLTALLPGDTAPSAFGLAWRASRFRRHA